MKITSVSDLIKELESLYNKHEVNPRDNWALFRGQRNEKWELNPSIARNDHYIKNEEEIFNTFKRKGYPFIDSQPDNNLDWLALAQHHGLPTRLIDWTFNPLIALWFAVRKPHENQDGKLFAYFPEKHAYNDDILKGPEIFDINEVMIYRPKHIVRRIPAQLGAFTIMPKINSVFEPFPDEMTVKFIIVKEKFEEINIQLDRLGINHATMLPDLDGLAKHLSWQFNFDSPNLTCNPSTPKA